MKETCQICKMQATKDEAFYYYGIMIEDEYYRVCWSCIHLLVCKAIIAGLANESRKAI